MWLVIDYKIHFIGHVIALIGYQTGKVVALGCKNKNCRFCKLGHSPDDHNCQLNYDGT